MNKKIKQILKDKKLLKTTIEKATESDNLAELQTSVRESIEPENSILTSKVLEEIPALLVGEHTIELDETFSEWSDLTTELFGEWNEEAAKAALILYREAGGVIGLDEEVFLTNGDLWYPGMFCEAVANEPTDFTAQSLLEADDSIFALPNKKCPVRNMTEAAWAEAYVHEMVDPISDEDKARYEAKVLEFGYDVVNQEYILVQTESGINLVTLPFNDWYNHETKEGISEETKEKITLAVQQFIPEYTLTSSILGEETMLNVIPDSQVVALYKEQTAKSYFAPLVGIVRKYEVTEEELQSLTKSYGIFGQKALESLLERSWKEQTESTEEDDEAIEPQPRATVQSLQETVTFADFLNEGKV